VAAPCSQWIARSPVRRRIIAGRSTGSLDGNMTVDENEATRWFAELEPDQRAAFLARVAHNLTVAARDYYQFETLDVADPKRLRRMNELQHRITSYLDHLLRGNEDKYWAPFIVEIMLRPGDSTIAEGTHWAWQISGGKGVAV
jgi:hypothetical protein